MRFAFVSFKYFPYGGLEKDMLRMAECAASRGHQVTVVTGKWLDDSYPDTPGISIKIIPCRGLSNHSRAASFCRNVKKYLKQENFDCVTAFNRIPGCDFYFAADNCYAVEMPRKHAAFILKIFPRYRTYLSLENGVFNRSSNTKIFYIAPHQKRDYISKYGTQEERFIELPPGMNPDCRRKENADTIRKNKRKELNIADNDIMLLLAGSNFRQKGGDRALQAIAALPEELRSRCRLFFAGADKSDFCSKLAAELGISDIVNFAGARKDIPELLVSCDALLLPARNEATGTVIVEAISAGTHVICSDECGFAPYAAEAGSTVLPSPWKDEAFTEAIDRLIKNRDELLEHAVEYSKKVDFTRRADCATDVMESFAGEKKNDRI